MSPASTDSAPVSGLHLPVLCEEFGGIPGYQPSRMDTERPATCPTRNIRTAQKYSFIVSTFFDLKLKGNSGHPEFCIIMKCNINSEFKLLSYSKSTCQSGLYALRWSTVLVDGTHKNTDENGVDYNALVLSQANLLAAIIAYGDENKSDKAYSIVSYCLVF